MSNPQLLLWIDLESTGLLDDPVSPTLLEAAWTVTNPAGVQLTPLSHAYCALRTGIDPLVTPDGSPAGAYWDHEAIKARVTRTGRRHTPYGRYPSDAVVTMHSDQPGKSGLATAWTDADPNMMINSWDEFERVMLDDLTAAGIGRMEKRQVIMAGGGISHYEARILPGKMARVFGRPQFHYAGLDVSTVLRSMRIRDPLVPGRADDLIERYRHTSFPEKITDWSRIAINPARFADPLAARSDFSALGQDNHRAHVGIARCLMAYRLLPVLMADTVVPPLARPVSEGDGSAAPVMAG